MHLSAAGNTLAPALAVLRKLGYTVTRAKAENGQIEYKAQSNSVVLVAEDALQLLPNSVVVAALVLCFACAPVCAQTERETKKAPSGHAVTKEAPQKKKAQQQQQRSDPWNPQDQRAKERVSEPPPGGHTARDVRPPAGPPSKAAQMQREEYEKRQEGQIPPVDATQVVQCRARPVCGGAYARCQSVAQTYRAANLQSSRNDIVQQCVRANTPDSCNCAAQCDRVAQCSIF